MQSSISLSWSKVLKEEFHKAYFINLSETVAKFYTSKKNRVST